MGIQKDLDELIRAEIISKETASAIERYYQAKPGSSQNRMILVFSILGALLIGLGLVLIIAHNWDQFSKYTKLFFAILPLAITQGLCLFTLLKKSESAAWREACAILLMFAAGTAISLVSQIYHIEGDMEKFLWIWMLVSLPIVYLMKSSATSLLVIAGITWFGMEAGYSHYPAVSSLWYWIFMLAMVPYYYGLLKSEAKGNFLAFHHWFFAISLTMCLGIISNKHEFLLMPCYVSMFGLFLFFADSKYFVSQKVFANAFLILGSLGTSVLLIAASFDDMLDISQREFWYGSAKYFSPEFIVGLAITAVVTFFQIDKLRNQNWRDIRPISLVYILFFVFIMMSFQFSGAFVFMNLLLLALGITTLLSGLKKDHLGIVNYGLILIAALIFCRFFDTDLSFVARGLIFIIVGIGFFVSNYLIIKKRKSNA